ncbi:GntR family transcriptional regulator [Yinghuangia seranimata]|uniref:GntR family transcriptional regulator n=1 Tax=Yinghuangia seranimata TaxID=408067 RepID=UPI00248CC0EA|nr:GntR family transcriptional regulator [Yinghuangia seranimata]MDI2130620.1 GntR family transcriptional regulator [Yinghuangia seranimata]
MATTATVEVAAEPKYWHLRTVLVQAIDSEFEAGQALPNERDLAARFGVARATLRQALEQLELEGRLHRKRGAGTVVAGPRLEIPMSTQDEGWPGIDLGDRQLVDGTTAAVPARLAARLGVRPRAMVHRVRRRQLSMGQTVGLECLYVPRAVVPRVPELLGDTRRAALVLRHLRHHPLEGLSRSVELGVAEPEDARLLERPPGTAVLVVTTAYAAQGRTAALVVTTYRADTCRLAFGDADSGPAPVGVGPVGTSGGRTRSAS